MENYIIKKCEYCDNKIKLKIDSRKNSITYGEILKSHKKRRFCSVECVNNWQKDVKWEDRIGKEAADRIRLETSKRMVGDKNPSKNKEVSKKISESLKKYLQKNPRIGNKNPFFGKHHTEECKDKHRKNKKVNVHIMKKVIKN